MRLIKVSLEKNIPFWFFGDIHLTPDSKVSGLFDIDSLDLEDLEKLDLSIKSNRIRAYDIDNNQISELSKHNLVGGYLPDDLQDIEIDKEEIPEIISITCDSEEEDEEIVISEEDREEAKILLNKNGNTVRRSIETFEVALDSIGIIYACLELEAETKSRTSVLKALNERIKEYEERGN